MDDLSKDVMPDKPVPDKMRKLLDKKKAVARKRIIERGIVHFRADREFMSALLDAADRLKTAPGPLCRRIVWERLQLSSQMPCVRPLDPDQSMLLAEALGCRIEELENFLAQLVTAGLGATTQVPVDVAALASELRGGQEEIRGVLKELCDRLDTGKPGKGSTASGARPGRKKK